MADDIAGKIDHTLLDIDADEGDIIRVCDEAKQYGFRAVCVRPGFVNTVSSYLDPHILVAAVIGFPKEKLSVDKIGNYSIGYKVNEAKQAISDGADELDMVVNVERLLNQDYKHLFDEVYAVVCLDRDVMVKVILETFCLCENFLREACRVVETAGAGCVKTSTGYGERGADVKSVEIMRGTVGNGMRVKASGGIKDYNIALEMIRAGADIIGTSSGVNIYLDSKLVK